MEKGELIITVSGQVASGKSHLTFLLKKFLREQGFEVEFGVNLEFPLETDFDAHMNKNINEAIDSIKKKRKITLNVLQLNRTINNK